MEEIIDVLMNDKIDRVGKKDNSTGIHKLKTFKPVMKKTAGCC